MLKCTSCGAENPDESRFCTECGTALAAVPGEAATCAGCGAPLPAGAKFCVACGRPAGGGMEPSCPACGTPVPAGSQFCTHCGARLAGQPADQPASAATPALDAAAAAYVRQVEARLGQAGFEQIGPVMGFESDQVYRRQQFELMMLNKVAAYCAIRRVVGLAGAEFVRNYSQALCRYGVTQKSGLGRLTAQPVVAYPVIVADACPPDTRAFLESYWPKHFMAFEMPVVVVPGTRELLCHHATPIWRMSDHVSILKQAKALFAP